MKISRASAKHRTPRPRVLVLLSGGVDSSTCVAFYKRNRFDVYGLFVDYGHPAVLAERRAARALTRHYRVPLHEVVIQGLPPQEHGYVPGRNALLVTAALSSGLLPSGLIALGIHAGTNYPDCSTRFITACQAVADVYSDGTIHIAAPFIEWTKGEILLFAKKARVPLRRTYSCERGRVRPCGRCLSCQDRMGVQ